MTKNKKDKQWSRQHYTEQGKERTTLKTVLLTRVRSSCSTSGTSRVTYFINRLISHEQEKMDVNVTTIDRKHEIKNNSNHTNHYKNQD